ncbi:MAG: DUF2304 domain-containing protein [Planctomycetes bacterium]|nr:DUF2304 domain-containing protein [Planctomycetota bacterium]
MTPAAHSPALESLASAALEIPIPADPLPSGQLVLALVLAFSMVAIVFELVRRQKLREEFALVWIGTAGVLVLLALVPDVLAFLANSVSAESSASILFFGAHVFLMLLALMFSVRLTKLTFRNKTLSQRVALLERRVEELLEAGNPTPGSDNTVEIPRAAQVGEPDHDKAQRAKTPDAKATAAANAERGS